ncbi:ImmA/IrrE family metallo-endopeptidase [Sphingomonas bacterium]|uniref:ImmA/IrrE family metallo-endopeptidase n=1 Tax=Sphingomonas bacterium TaxID=1895847 RepID=UPI0015773728|nr:ImmA/IrrE family metallo-endopeptidase [Sphingomonas bacterium]
MINVEQQAILDSYTAQIPVPVGKLASDLGLPIGLAALSPSISGLIEPDVNAPSGFRIRVNRYETDERQRFTIAHEIAHYLLHRDYIRSGVVDSVMYRSSLSSAREAEANRLAANIVMPYSRVMDELKKLGGKRDEISAAAIARTFRVSLPAMKVRLEIK